jgi:hypothetical protein
MPLLYKKTRPSQQRVPGSWWSNSGDFWTPDGQGGRRLYDNLADELYPTGESFPVLDVVNKFPWTLTPTTSEARKEAPYIILREFLQLETQLNQSLLPYGNRVDGLPLPQFGGVGPGSSEDESGLSLLGIAGNIASLLQPIDSNIDSLYKGLFDHINPTYFYYKLPYFTPEYFNINNNWEGTDVLDKIIAIQTQIGRSVLTPSLKALFGDKGEGAGKFFAKIPETYKKLEIFNIKAGNPAVGLMDPPHVWKNTANRTYSFEFPLYNINVTGAANPTQLIQKNWEFCYLLTYQNMINKRNFYTAIPPVFYEVIIPGIHYCKASYISDLTIENIGNLRRMKLPINNNPNSDVNVPDAYSVKITLTDLLQPSKNLLQSITDINYRNQIQAGIANTQQGI